MRNPTISATKVSLHPKTLADAPRDYIWQKDAELAVLNAQMPVRMPFIQYLTQHTTFTNHNHARTEYFAIKTLADGRHIGNCAVYDIDRDRVEAQIGIAIGDRRYWGQGYGQDSTMALIGYAFNHLGLRRIYLKTLQNNQRARHCFGRCGFKSCGSLLENGQTFIVMELMYEDYLSRELARCQTFGTD